MERVGDLLLGKLALLHPGPPFLTKFYHWFWTSFSVLEQLQEGKELLANLQATMVKHQAEEYVAQQRPCPHCDRQRSNKGTHEIVWRSLFGKLKIQSPRLYSCSCRPQEKKSFSPLAALLPERSAPELLYLQTKWGSLMSYGLTAEILADVLPMQTNVQSVILNTQKVAARLEAELGEEQLMFAHGCMAEWEALPPPDGRLTVGLDGGYIRSRKGNDLDAGWFEVIAGKSVPWEGDAKCFGFVNNYDEKPKRRLYEVLKSQGLQMNQDITFLSEAAIPCATYSSTSAPIPSICSTGFMLPCV
jgi:hypothetical protein